MTNRNESGIITRSRESAAMILENWTTREKYKAYKYVRIRISTILWMRILLKQKVKEAKSKTRRQSLDHPLRDVLIQWFREFDPGSGWTLAACITHSSRTELMELILREALFKLSGGRVSNAWATCPFVWNNVWKRTLIPHNARISHGNRAKDLLQRDGLASD